jgi:hypothetical protein
VKQIGLALCAVVMVASCGARPEKSKDGNDQLAGIQNFLQQRFSKADAVPDGGGLCGDPMLMGSVVGAVPSAVSGCGVQNAVSLRAIGNVTLSQPATMDCTTAGAVKSWLETGVKPAVGKMGGGVSGLKVAAHYVCRTRNHKKGAKISEHGKGRAIDISAVYLADGDSISVLDDWGRGKKGKALREMHSAACGPFGTVLGPNADVYHKDHFHFDTARHRGGSYCR